MNTKCTIWLRNFPNSHESIPKGPNIPNGKIPVLTFSHLRPSKIYPNWDFWFENKPSGNPDSDSETRRHISQKLEPVARVLEIARWQTKRGRWGGPLDQGCQMLLGATYHNDEK
jgi:hypothetical protein